MQQSLSQAAKQETCDRAVSARSDDEHVCANLVRGAHDHVCRVRRLAGHELEGRVESFFASFRFDLSSLLGGAGSRTLRRPM